MAPQGSSQPCTHTHTTCAHTQARPHAHASQHTHVWVHPTTTRATKTRSQQGPNTTQPEAGKELFGDNTTRQGGTGQKLHKHFCTRIHQLGMQEDCCCKKPTITAVHTTTVHHLALATQALPRLPSLSSAAAAAAPHAATLSAKQGSAAAGTAASAAVPAQQRSCMCVGRVCLCFSSTRRSSAAFKRAGERTEH